MVSHRLCFGRVTSAFQVSAVYFLWGIPLLDGPGDPIAQAFEPLRHNNIEPAVGDFILEYKRVLSTPLKLLCFGLEDSVDMKSDVKTREF